MIHALSLYSRATWQQNMFFKHNSVWIYIQDYRCIYGKQVKVALGLQESFDVWVWAKIWSPSIISSFIFLILLRPALKEKQCISHFFFSFFHLFFLKMDISCYLALWDRVELHSKSRWRNLILLLPAVWTWEGIQFFWSVHLRCCKMKTMTVYFMLL